ncbi:N,N-dimethylformamidase beta subunit family domain-containing protein [Sinorhizobium meliloti]|uniref:N,N-dimethylformamidase beta subunit family domain-containing protein n=1 Tax=Rhizobium meliloti TaxID=382 RepID=UPI00035DA06A|nr:N,N-dimethylformamidase beta subunit family domain-containing protein [Sinorhizobium meliloti]
MFETRRLRGYTDYPSYRPGDTIQFRVSSDVANYEATFVRLIAGDPSPQGPGHKEEELQELGRFNGRKQETQIGSFVEVPHADQLVLADGFTIHAFIQPTLPGGKDQTILSKWCNKTQTGWILDISADGFLRVRTSNGRDGVSTLTLRKPLFGNVWYSVATTFNVRQGRIRLIQRSMVNSFNSRFGPVVPLDSNDSATLEGVQAPGNSGGPLIIAGAPREADSGRIWIENLYNGKIDSPSLRREPLTGVELDDVMHGRADSGRTIARWDFSARYSLDGAGGDQVVDLSHNAHHGACVNQPSQGCTGWNWTGKVDCYAVMPSQYGALLFHDDAMDDCRWDADFDFTVPQDLKSGVYAMRLRGEGLEDYITFFVTPATGSKRAPVVVVMSTFTYMAYGNFYPIPNWPEGTAGDFTQEANFGGVSISTERDLEVNGNVAPYGLANYDRHSDGAGVIYATWRKPMLMLRPKHLTTWNFEGDLALIDWLEQKGVEYDVITDHEVHANGLAELKEYRAVMTTTHPEYCTSPYIDAWEQYLASGGRGMYLGGNGMYWVTALHGDKPWLLEVRRGEVGDGAWQSEPGEQYMSTTCEHGGLWRNRGRSGYKIWGTSYAAHALEQGTYYVQLPDALDDRVRWIFDGVDPSEKIGDFGLGYNGAASVEVDRYDLRHGTPPHAMLLASSIEHGPNASLVPEEMGGTHPHVSGVEHPMVRADMTYFSTPNGGAMFSTSSIGWILSLNWNDYDNNVSTITLNVIKRFAEEEPVPLVC